MLNVIVGAAICIAVILAIMAISASADVYQEGR